MTLHDDLPDSSVHGASATESDVAQATLQGAPDFSVSDLETLVRGILEAPPEDVDSRVVALVRGATKARPRFPAWLALRALQLQQGLREVQEQVIRLQWELAQLKRRDKQRPRASD